MTITPPPELGAALSREAWTARAAAHAARADRLTAEWRERAGTQLRHPVWDFLFTYYSYRPSQLRRWHPGAGLRLEQAPEYAQRRWYRSTPGGVELDARAYLTERGRTVDFVADLLRGVLDRPAHFSCFCLHEWAMVYHLGPGEQRHHTVPLRLGGAATDAVVESHHINCSHYDAYRFFAPDAVARNELHPTRATQTEDEQSGCLHANMDVYKWATKLAPIIPGDLMLDSLELAFALRAIDMRASPYDVGPWGFPAIPIETPAGKAEFVTAQRELSTRANTLRRRMLAAIAAARSAA